MKNITVITLVSLLAVGALLADEFAPEPVTAKSFAALTGSSPFVRSVGLSDSVVLTGVARIEKEVFATLYDTETAEIQVITTTANSKGWQLVDVRGDETDLESLTAKIQIGGGEVISVRYEKVAKKKSVRKSTSSGSSSRSGSGRLSEGQMKEAKSAAIDYKKGFSGDGYRDRPPAEIVKKLSKISTQQRESINRKMIELRNRGLGTEQRKKIYNDAVNRASQGR